MSAQFTSHKWIKMTDCLHVPMLHSTAL